MVAGLCIEIPDLADTYEEGDEMIDKNSDIRSVDRNALKSINSVKIDPSLDKEGKMRSFVEQIGNPCCYLDGETVVKISYAETDTTLEEQLRAYIYSLG